MVKMVNFKLCIFDHWGEKSKKKKKHKQTKEKLSSQKKYDWNILSIDDSNPQH